MRFSCFRYVLIIGSFLLSGQAIATSAEQTATRFFSSLESLVAEFHQTVVNSEQQVIQDSTGTLWIQRPGKFRWDYLTPYRQQIVADGTKLWSYDEDLEQVTVQPLTDILSATPAMLLSGEQPLTDVFRIEVLDSDTVKLVPKTDAGNIISLVLVFNNKMLASLEAQDALGNTTTFEFTAVKRNGAIDGGLFNFTPPENADVVGSIH